MAGVSERYPSDPQPLIDFVLGTPIADEQTQLIDVAADVWQPEPNPMRTKLGAGPEGKLCKTCRWLDCHQYGRRRFYKCGFRGDTAGAATDHRLRWKACRKYAEKT